MWYAKVVCELLILAQGNRWNCTGKGKHDSGVFLRLAPRSWSSHDSRIMEPPAEEAPLDAPRCGNPDCPDPTSASRLQLLHRTSRARACQERSTFIARKGSALGGVGSRMRQSNRGASGLLIP